MLKPSNVYFHLKNFMYFRLYQRKKGGNLQIIFEETFSAVSLNQAPLQISDDA